MSTSTVGTVLDTLVAALDAVTPALDGVNVFSGPVSTEEGGQESIEFDGEIGISEDAASMEGYREETFTLEGSIYVVKSWQAASGSPTTEKTIKAARDRALAIFAQIETYLNDNPTIGGTCLTSDITAGSVEQFYGDFGRGCVLSFTVTVRSFKNP